MFKIFKILISFTITLGSVKLRILNYIFNQIIGFVAYYTNNFDKIILYLASKLNFCLIFTFKPFIQIIFFLTLQSLTLEIYLLKTIENDVSNYKNQIKV